MKRVWRKKDIVVLLERNDRAVERAIVVIFERQTEDEKVSNSTKHVNGRGFTAYEAKYGSYLARWVKSGKQLTGLHLKKARGMTKRYRGQLMEEANNK